VLDQDADTEGVEVRAVFSPVIDPIRQQVVRITLDGRQVALGAVVTESGYVLTKASEIAGEAGTLMTTFADGATVESKLLVVDRSNDLALLATGREGLPSIDWSAAAEDQALGQWVITPGIERLPVAVGVLSAAPRTITGVRLGLVLNDTDQGPVVVQTMPGMGAAAAGLKPNDRIVQIAGEPIDKFEQVLETLQAFNAGDRVLLIADRAGRSMRFDVELKLRPLDVRGNRTDQMNTAGNEVSTRRDGFERVIQHDATIEPDACGGPIVNLKGQVIGLNIARAGRIEAYALPADLVEEALAAMLDSLAGDEQ
jgi:serine protease Do